MKNRRDTIVLWCVLAVPVAWLAVMLASALDAGDGLAGFMAALSGYMAAPFSVHLNPRTGPFVLAALVCYAIVVYVYDSEHKNRRPGEEHGTAQWGSADAIRKRYEDRTAFASNRLLTQNFRMGLNGRKHRRNLNTLVVGGSGAGKTLFYVKPNVMQLHSSYLVTDPKGEILRCVGSLLEQEGYRITVLDLVDMQGHYNPLRYVRDDKDVLKLISNLIKNTTPKGAQSSDPFWDKAETALLTALILFLKHEAEEKEQNFSSVMMLLGGAEIKEDDEEHRSPLDLLFEDLEQRDPDSIAVKQYRIFRQAAGKTAKSILISAAVRLAAFNLPEVAAMTDTDEMDFYSLGEEKRAIFAIIPDNDTSLNYLVGMLYTQAFQILYHVADKKHRGLLPVHVHVLMDEFANVALPDDFERVLSTCRSRNISISIIIQNLAQIKALFEKSWENLTGNCDSFLYLGGNEQSTHEYVSKLLGKATIDTKTRGLTRGRQGSSSENFQNAGRELLTPDEVRGLDNEYAILFIRGEDPVLDKKYDTFHHPKFSCTEDGGAPGYAWIVKTTAVTEDLSFAFTSLDDIEILE